MNLNSILRSLRRPVSDALTALVLLESSEKSLRVAELLEELHFLVTDTPRLQKVKAPQKNLSVIPPMDYKPYPRLDISSLYADDDDAEEDADEGRRLASPSTHTEDFDRACRFALYITHHKCGWYYIGRGQTALLEAGKYTGSGVYYNALRYEVPDGWTTEILTKGLTLDEAIEGERRLLDPIDDDLCLNLLYPSGDKWQRRKNPWKRFIVSCRHHWLKDSKAYLRDCAYAEVEPDPAFLDGSL
jgi:hypothetical protein